MSLETVASLDGNGGTAELQVRPKVSEWESEEAGKEEKANISCI